MEKMSVSEAVTRVIETIKASLPTDKHDEALDAALGNVPDLMRLLPDELGVMPQMVAKAITNVYEEHFAGDHLYDHETVETKALVIRANVHAGVVEQQFYQKMMTLLPDDRDTALRMVPQLLSKVDIPPIEEPIPPYRVNIANDMAHARLEGCKRGLIRAYIDKVAVPYAASLAGEQRDVALAEAYDVIQVHIDAWQKNALSRSQGRLR